MSSVGPRTVVTPADVTDAAGYCIPIVGAYSVLSSVTSMHVGAAAATAAVTWMLYVGYVTSTDRRRRRLIKHDI